MLPRERTTLAGKRSHRQHGHCLFVASVPSMPTMARKIKFHPSVVFLCFMFGLLSTTGPRSVRAFAGVGGVIQCSRPRKFWTTSSAALSASSTIKRRIPVRPISATVRFMSNTSSGGDKDADNHENLIQLQATASSSASPTSSSSSTNLYLGEEEHLRHQQDVFDSISEWFADREKEVTPELEPVYQAMAEDILSKFVQHVQNGRQKTTTNSDKQGENDEDAVETTTVHILDVACGTGVLWEFLMEAANAANIQLVITGVDLSPSMVNHAATRAQQLLESLVDEDDHSPNHSIQIVASDVQSFCATADPSAYDGIILNACFGNFWDPKAVLEALPKGPSVIAISHPLGASFVQQLHDQDPKTVPHTLPPSTLAMVQQWTFGLMPSIVPTYFKSMPYYLMILDHQNPNRRAKPLPQIQRYRGIVDQGYGRGGKKLGVPTANLPASLFQNALADVTPGVYFGWATLEHLSRLPQQRRVFKAVVNVGYSPTFQGQENKEKIIEAHLIINRNKDDKDDYAILPDFYGETMRLQLCGYLRDEQKFDSFPALIAQIHADIAEARETLDNDSPFRELHQDPFLLGDAKVKPAWVGSGGGDENASWEFVDHLETLTAMVEAEK